MASSALQDQALLDSLFQQSMSPINTYSQGLLALALQRRQQADQLASERQRQAAASQGLKDRLAIEHDFKTADEKEEERKKMVAQAKEYGADIPMDASYETALNAFVTQHGESLVSLNKRAGDAVRRITQGTGMTGQAFAQRVANEIASSPEVAKVLTPAEQENIRNHPDQINQIRAGFAKTPKKYEAFKNAEKSALDMVSAQIEKESSSKPDVVAATGELKMIYSAMEAEEKRGGFSPAVREQSRQAFHDAVYPPQPPQPTTPTLPPPPPRRPVSAVNPAAAAPTDNIFRRWYYGQDQAPAYQGVGAPSPGVNAPTMSVAPVVPPGAIQPTMANPLEALRLQSLGIPVTAPVPTLSGPGRVPAMSPGQGAVIDPSVLSALRLQSTIQDATTNQNSLFPTAFPLLSVPNR